MQKPFLSPLNDAVFKMLFGDSRDIELLTWFLQSALTIPAEDYEELIFPDPHLMREGWDDKLGILDVKLKTRSGRMIDIEIQLLNQPDLRSRIVFYLAKMVTEQLSEGDSYQKIRPAICILITNFTLIRENSYYHNRYRLHDAQSGSEFTDLLEINTLELPKLPQDDGSTLWDWLGFLKAKNTEELTMLADKNPQIKKAVAKLQALTEDESARMLADSRNKLRWDITSMERAAREEGLERGLERGREEGLEQVARNALKRGDSIENIAELTGLAPEKIRALMLH
jgi:predicted transposase/invertase (TIGR01784 family)